MPRKRRKNTFQSYYFNSKNRSKRIKTQNNQAEEHQLQLQQQQLLPQPKLEQNINLQTFLECGNENQKIIKPSKTSSFKIPLDEPEIENPAVISENLNDYSSHWPDYLKNYENEPIAVADHNNESIAATNPFSSEDEDHQNLNSMKEVDVKQFVETISQPEISIKEEPNDIMDDYSYDDINESFIEPEAILSKEDCHKEDVYMVNDYYLPQNKFSKSSTDPFIYQRNPETNMFYCVECQLEFKLRRNLVRHMLTHTDDRPFTCHLCFKTFKRKDNLQKHLRDVHQKNFSCKLCEKKFGSMQQLRRHNKTSRHTRSQ